MITKRVIPCLDIDNGRVVKGVNFVDLIDAGDPVAMGFASLSLSLFPYLLFSFHLTSVSAPLLV